MSNTQKAIWAFWIFIFVAGGWEFYSYNQSMTQKAQDEAARDTNHGHYFFYQSSKKPPKPQDVTHASAFLIQTGTKVEHGVPSSIYFTYDVTLKNIGSTKATNIQVRVRPFRGVYKGDPDFTPGNQEIKTIDDSDPVAQIDAWLTFPDLDPGQSATMGTSFFNKPNYDPGKNPNPDIHFTAAKS